MLSKAPHPHQTWGTHPHTLPGAGDGDRWGQTPPHPPGHPPTCQDTGQVEEADAQDAVHHLQGHPDHQLQEGVEPQLLQPARAQEWDTPWLSSRSPPHVPVPPPPGRNLPHVHEHVGEEAPGACPVPGVVDQGALHVLGVVGLQHPLVQPGPVAEEHNDLCQTPRWSALALLRPPCSCSFALGQGHPAPLRQV